jgi:fatty-acyl-CoA synthase
MSETMEGQGASYIPSYVRGDVDTPLLGDTIGTAFDRAVQRYGDSTALVVSHQQVAWSYAELASNVANFAAGLFRLGLMRGDRIGIWAPNCVEWTVTQYAAAKLGLILVNLNPAYRVTEIEFALNKAGCRALVLADRFKASDYIQMLRTLAPELASSAPGKLKAERLPNLEIVIQLGSESLRGVFCFDEISTLGKDVDRQLLIDAAARLDCDDPINIQFTSGTTGSPKGATLSHRNLLNSSYFTGRICGISSSDAICVPLPLYHVFGMAIGNLLAMLFGAKVVHPGETFEPGAVLEAVEREQCTSLYGVPTMFIAQLASPDFKQRDLSSLRTGIIAGASVPMELMRRVIADMRMEQVVIGYGMTETSATVMITSPADTLERRVATVGRVVPHVEVKVVDERSEIVARGQVGEICVRGYSVMLGYWEDRQKTAEAIDPDGWMHTGDLGTIDRDGYGRIVGRLKELVIRGGENISPPEIEEFLHRHPKIEMAQIVGVPDEKYGEELCACIKTKSGAKLSDEEVREFCRGEIAHFKIPRHVRFVEIFPMTASGKVQKYLLAEQSARELGLRS